MKPGRGWILCFVLLGLGHMLLLLAGTLERSADGWIHLFFSSHWQQSWWQDWNPRWSEGFSVFAYPPLAHQLLAGLAWVFGLAGAGILGMLLFLGLLAWGLYRYAQPWFGTQSALLGAALALNLSATSIAVHVFGQLPNLLALALMLHALAWVQRWLLAGESGAYWPALWLTLAAALSSLYLALFGLLFFALPLLLQLLAEPVPGAWRRIGFLLALLLPLSLLALAPALYFRLHEMAPDALPIYHSSRSNVLAWKSFNWFMFYGQYGIFLVLLPLWLGWAWRERNHRLFLLPVLLLFGLSLGGATPLARCLLGPLFEILTLERFGQWAALLLCPLLADSLLRLWRAGRFKPWLVSLVLLHLAGGLYSATTAWWKPLPVLSSDLPALVQWLEAPEKRNYRYLSLGLGRASFAKLGALTRVSTPDGNFPFGRNQPLLNRSGVASLDDARKYGPKGYQALAKVLAAAPELSLKWLLVADPSYHSWLRQQGWQPTDQVGTVQIWSRAHIPALLVEQARSAPWPLRLIWGLLPLGCLVVGGLGICRQVWTSRQFD